MGINDTDSLKDSKAIALKYDTEAMPAPQVVAKGSGTMAQQIIRIAKENNIEIKSDKELVDILSILEVESFIPLQAYEAVAEILSYIYKKNAQEK